MNTFCLFFLPIFFVVNTLLSIYLSYKIIYPSIRNRLGNFIAQELPLKEMIQKKLDEGDGLSIKSFMEKRYETFIAILKKRIPMAELFLTGSLESSLKRDCPAEIDRLCPEFNDLIMEKILTPDQIEKWIKKEKLSFEKIVAKFLKIYLWKVIFTLAALSLCIGLIQLLFLLMLC